LSRDEEHVLSEIPREYVTTAAKIRLAARMPENKAQKILERLIAGSKDFIAECATIASRVSR
jgi:hypothetical protein